MLDKTIIIYKGDQLTAYFYLGLGMFMVLASGFLFAFTQKIGWFYLAIGLSLFAAFSIGKAVYVYFKANQKLGYFNQLMQLSNGDLKQEIVENHKRLDKKALNRRRYLYTLISAFVLLIGGIIFGETGLAIGSFVPVILYAGIEFCVSLLSEFRLWEYQRQLEKYSETDGISAQDS